jgi:hypothetical protein
MLFPFLKPSADLPRHTADERHHVDVHGNPVRQRLRPDRFRKGVARGPSTATKISARRTSPVAPSITAMV